MSFACMQSYICGNQLLVQKKEVKTRGTWDCPKNVVHMCDRIEQLRFDNNASSARFSFGSLSNICTKSDGPD